MPRVMRPGAPGRISAAKSALHDEPARGLPHRRSRSRLALEISVALCVKFALLYLVWMFWFSHPGVKQMTEHSVAADLFGPVSNEAPRQETVRGSRP